MDLIYMNEQKEDIGVLKDYKFDLAFGASENDFECIVSTSNNVCKAGYYLYYESSEYGGIIDSVEVDTEKETVTYKGRTWHGMLESQVLQPDENEDYLVLSGEANTVINSLIARMGLQGLFKASSDVSELNISDYKMNRYIKAYTGIRKMLKSKDGKLNLIFSGGFVELSAKPLVNYAEDEQFDTDQISFKIQKNYKPINHVICLGKGDLKERRVIHVYADIFGNISGNQTLFGLDEICVTYDNANAESDDELVQGGIDIIADSYASDKVEFDFETDSESFDIGDIIGAKEFTTNTTVTASIAKKIVSIKDNTTSISYSCEAGTGTVASSGYPSSGSGEVSVDIATVDKAGIVKPDGTTITIDEDGTIHAEGGSSGAGSNVHVQEITSGTVVAGGTTTFDVTFENTYLNPPKVFVIYYPNTAYRDRAAYINSVPKANITTTGCRINIVNPYTSDWALSTTRSINILIVDTDGSSSNEGIIYSTKERCIGRWVDNKPLYQKTYIFNLLPQNLGYEALYNANLQNVANVTLIGFIKLAESWIVPLNMPRKSFSESCSCLWNGQGFLIWVGNAVTESSLMNECNITIQYTKTTD